MSKNILLITRSFYPEMTPRAYRATELAKGFVAAGHQVTVLLPDDGRDLTEFCLSHPIKVKKFGPLIWKDLGRSRIIGDLKRKFGRLLYLLFDYPNIEILWRVLPVLKKLSGYDLAITIAVPHELNWAFALARNNKHQIAKTWVADCGDPFMGNRLDTINPPFYFAWFEKNFCKKADFVSVPTQSSIQAYYPQFHHKFKVIPQGFNFDEVKLFAEPITHEQPTFAYAGKVSTQGVRSIGLLIEKVIELNKPFQLHIYGPQAKEILKHYEVNYCDKIIVHDPLPRLELLYELSKMDFLLNLDNGTTRNTPSKLIDYALTKRPILNTLAQKPDMHLFEEFFNKNYQNQYKIENVEQYNIKNIIQHFLDLTSP